MQSRFFPASIALAAVIGALPASAGGGGPLVISRISGRAEIKPLDRAEYWRDGGERWKIVPIGPRGRWRPVETAGIDGTCLLRTGPRSWVHLQGRWCVDPNSLIRIESGSDFRIVVLRGRVSAVDGRGRGVFREYDSGTREGVVR
jgi:hypothetical protein